MEHYYPYHKCKNEIGGSINSTDSLYFYDLKTLVLVKEKNLV